MMTIEHFLKNNNKARIQNGNNYMGYNDKKEEFVIYGLEHGAKNFDNFSEAFDYFMGLE